MSFLTELTLINQGSRRVLLWSHLSLTLGCAILFFLFQLGSSGLNYVGTYVLGLIPDQELKVGIKKKDVAFFRMTEPGMNEKITEGRLNVMRRLEGVSRIWTLSYGNLPSEVKVNFMGKVYRSEMVIQGFDPSWIEGEMSPDKLVWQPGDIVPVVVNSQLLTIYNTGYAKSQGLPELSAQAMMTPILNITYGDPAKGKTVSLRARIVGMSSKVALGAAVPISVLEHMHAEIGMPAPPVTEAVLALGSGTDMDAVRRQVTALGYTVEEPHPMARVLRQLRGLGMIAGFLLIACVCLFGLAYLNQTLKMLFLIKRHDYAVCRAMGMSRRRLRFLLMVELLAGVGIDLFVGLAIGYGLASWLNTAFLDERLTNLVGLAMPLTFPWGWALSLALLVLVSGVVFLIPRILAGTRDPAGYQLGQYNL